MRSAYYLLVLLSALLFSCSSSRSYVMSVQGKLKPGDLGHTLIHEHVTTDFIGAEKVAQPQYELEDALPVVLPHFQKLKALGINTLVECTPNYIGRDVRLLQEISERSGIHIITNTGYYAAVDKKYLPRHAFEEDAETIAARWQKEWEEGIDGTPIRPGFIKLGVGQGPLDEIEEKLLVAGIQLSKKSGLPIYVHTGDGAAAQSEYDILTREGLAPDQLIWVHAQNGTDEERIALANKGVWVSLDGVNVSRLDQYVHMIQAMKSGGVLSHLLVSHDDGWSVEKEGGQIKLKGFGFGDGMPYVTISEQLIPKLQKAGFTEGEIKQIMIQNPRTALSIRRSSNKMVAHE